jgi:Carboxypeptidase regulatory-like domain
MRRVTGAGVCLVAVLAASMLVAASASAGGPEYMICAKAPKGAGAYLDAACSKPSGEGKGNYERVSWAHAKKKAFKGKNEGTPHLTIVNVYGDCTPGAPGACAKEPAKAEGATQCAKEALAGEVTGPKTSTWKTEYSHCEAGSDESCSTAGQKAGVIVTEELESELVWLDKAHTKAGIKVKGKGPGGRLAQYECHERAVNVEVFGDVLAEVVGNVGIANKATEDVTAEGMLHLQGVGGTGVEGSPDEEGAKVDWEWKYAFAECLKGGQSEAECAVMLGGEPFAGVQLLTSVVSGAENVTAPSIQSGVSSVEGEAFLIAGGGSGPPSETGSVIGTVTEAPSTPVSGASVSICSDGNCYEATTEANGSYEIHGVADGTYVAHVSPPSSSAAGELTSGTFGVVGTNTTTENLTLTGPTPPPSGTVVTGNGTVEVGGHKYPQIFWRAESPMTTQACKGGTVRATIIAINTLTGMPEATDAVTFSENPANSGAFEGRLPAVDPLHGEGKVVIEVTGCPKPSEEGNVEFTIYIDPSGTVVDGNKGDAPVSGATVTLFRSETESGSYSMVENGSAIMSIGNRNNSSASTADGEFGWDVTPGWYKVEAAKAGCLSDASPSFKIPPEVIDIQLVLHCKEPLKITTSSLPEATRGSAYSVKLEAVGGEPPYKWKKLEKLPKGMKLSKEGVLEATEVSTKNEPKPYTVKVKVSDHEKKAAKETATAELSLTLN